MRPILLSLIAFLPLVQAFATPNPYHQYRLDQSLADNGAKNSTLISVGTAPVYDSGHLTHLSSDYATSFNGGDYYLTAATNFLTQHVDQAYTVSAWFKPDRAPGVGERFFVFETSPNYSASLGLRDGDDSSKTKIQFYAQTEGSNSETISVEIPDSEITARWYHAALTFDGTTLTAYLDGESVGSLNLSGKGAIKPATSLRIGTYRDANSRFFVGDIDEVAVWISALSASQIKDLSDQAATTHYVNFLNIGLDAAPYSSWGTAAVDLQDVLAIARPGDEIWVAKGTYYPDQGEGQTNNDQSATFTLKNRVAIYGGFQGGETSKDEADPAAYPTILSGDIDQNNGSEEQRNFTNHANNSFHVVTAENVDDTALLNGLTIKYGFAAGDEIDDQQGAGLFCKNASPTLVNLTFEANVAVAGAAISFDTASPSIANSTFRNNTAADAGAFYAQNSSSPTITNSVFHGNIALDNGGAVFNYESTPSFTNCLFYDNTSDKEAGVFFNYDSNPVLTNCTLYGNSSDREGGALYNTETSFPKLRNSIIWNNQAEGVTNTADASIYNEDGSATVASHSIVENIAKTTLDASGTATNIGAIDPLFLHPDPVATGNFQLRPASFAIDAGDNAANDSSTDLAGNSRIQNTTIDLGAVEGGSTLHLYVKKNNAGAAAPYDSWTTAAATLQDALEYSGYGDEIWVAQGTYYPDEGGSQTDNDRDATFTLTDSLSLYGGFIGNETERSSANPQAYETILSGDIDQNDGADFTNTANNSSHVVTARNISLLDGFTVTGGNANSGTLLGDQESGGGFFASWGNFATISNCSFHSNQAHLSGAAIFNKRGTLRVTNTSIQGNSTVYSGGGVDTYKATTTLTNCLITGNKAEEGAGFYNYQSNLTLINCTLEGNRSIGNGGAVYVYSSGSSLVFKNSIIWNNQADGATNTESASVYYQDGGTPIYQHCLIENLTAAAMNASTNIDPPFSGDNLEPANPRFLLEVDPATAPTTAGDLRLGPGSPAINAGDNATNVITTDVAVNARIQNDTIDLGAYETPGANLGFWSVSTPRPIDSPSLSISYPLTSGTLPSDWHEHIAISVISGQLSHSDPTFSNSGSEYTITLNNLAGEGTFTVGFEADDQAFHDSGFVPLGTTGGTFQRYTTDTPVHYVNAANNTPEAPYDTWSKAAANLQDALLYAASGDDIWVAQGTYYPDEGGLKSDNDRAASFILKSNVAIFGGFAGNEIDIDAADPRANETILSGDIDKDNTAANNSGHVISYFYATNALLQGFTIEGGNSSDSGGAIVSYSSDPFIKDCIFRNNRANKGGAINSRGDSTPFIVACSFIGNEADLDGGAILNEDNSYLSIFNCLFSGNKAGDEGGALYLRESSWIEIVNSTFNGNQAATFGGAIRNAADTFPTVKNSIIWGNQADGATNTASASVYPSEAGASYHYSIVQNYSKDDLDGSSDDSENNFNQPDPLFLLEANPANAPTLAGNQRLRSDSPAINAGDQTATATPFDLDGNNRTLNGEIDLGAYELAPYTQAPVIVLIGDADISIAPDTQWIDPGATATDQGGASVSVTSNETFPAGKIVITYDATDTFGNEAVQVTRTVTFADLTTPPTITLNGSELTTVPFGSIWSDPGATAKDVLGDAVAVTTGGDTVDTTQSSGVFTITYDATDSFDNDALQVTREVHIVGVIEIDPNSNNTLDTLTWTDGWVLQTSTDLEDWTDVPNAQSPFDVSAFEGTKRFWRLRKAE